MSDNTKTVRVSLPLLPLGLVFVVLKLTGYIDWSWWLVTLPFWGGLAIVLGFMVFVLLFVALVAAISD